MNEEEKKPEEEKAKATKAKAKSKKRVSKTLEAARKLKGSLIVNDPKFLL